VAAASTGNVRSTVAARGPKPGTVADMVTVCRPAPAAAGPRSASPPRPPPPVGGSRLLSVTATSRPRTTERPARVPHASTSAAPRRGQRACHATLTPGVMNARRQGPVVEEFCDVVSSVTGIIVVAACRIECWND
jgi:hypothetical protein